jgi:hypothetical protein
MKTDEQTKHKSLTAWRLQRTAAGVIAQYIQDLTHPVQPAPCPPAA